MMSSTKILVLGLLAHFIILSLSMFIVNVVGYIIGFILIVTLYLIVIMWVIHQITKEEVKDE
jgi:hypothetical protein